MTASWLELLGLPAGTRAPTLYEVLGLDRRLFDAKQVDGAFATRMQRLSARTDPGEKTTVERAKEELLRARRVLKSPEARAVYEEDLAKKAPAAKRPPPAATPAPPKATPRSAPRRAPPPRTAKTPPTQLDAGARGERRRSDSDKPTRADARTPVPPPRGGPGPAPPASFLVGRVIDDKYEVVEQLGEGGMGTVYKARHKLLEKFVALKVLNPDLAFRPQIRERFLREARAAMEFVHPNAVPLRDFGHTKDGLLYMTQDYSPGRSLRAVLDLSKRLEVPRALALARQCLLALGEAHRKGIVHRDVKPENILVERDASGAETARVCDFGIAKIVDEGTATTGLTGGAVIGTPHYMAPEQAAGDSVGARADIYALGCVLHEAITGRYVFDADTAMQVIMMQVTQKPAPPSKHLPGLARSIDALVLKALGKTPQSRFQTADEFVAAIDAVGEKVTSSSVEVAVTRPSRPPPPAKRGEAGRGARRDRVEGVQFCGGCGASLPANWREKRQGKRLGPRVLCLACYAPVKTGKTCMGCLQPIRPGMKSMAAGRAKRLCEPCASKGEYLRVCASCDLLLPYVAFERKEAFAVGGVFYCKDCHRRRS